MAAGAAPALGEALKHHIADAVTCRSILQAIGHCICSEKAGLAMHSCVGSLVIGALRMHSSDEGVTEGGCWSVARMSKAAKSALALTEAGAPLLVLTALRRSKGDTTCMAAGTALITLSQHNPRESLRKLLATGAVEQLFDVLRGQLDRSARADVVYSVCSALALMFHVSWSDAEAVLIKPARLQLLVDVLRRTQTQGM